MSFGNTFKNLKLRYSYKLASLISDIIISDEVEEKLRGILWGYSKEPEDYFSELLIDNIDKILNPSKETILHSFIKDIYWMDINNDIYWFNDTFYDYGVDELEEYIYSTFVSKLEFYGVIIDDFPKTIKEICFNFEMEGITEEQYNSQISEYVDSFMEAYEKIENKMTDEVFYLLFNDKMFLFEFNKILARYIIQLDKEKFREIFDASNKVKRCTHLPKWLEKAIYFRDNGVCQECGRDLSGYFNIVEERGMHFDHILPLEEGGINDPTNFRVLCSNCNLSKSDKIKTPQCYYQYYW